MLEGSISDSVSRRWKRIWIDRWHPLDRLWVRKVISDRSTYRQTVCTCLVFEWRVGGSSRQEGNNMILMKAVLEYTKLIEGGFHVHHVPSGRVLWASLFRMFVLTSPDMTCMYQRCSACDRHDRGLATTNRYHFDTSIRSTISHPSRKFLLH